MAFAGKVVVVTGSSSGIGCSAALMFAREGAVGLVIHGQSPDRLKETHDLIIAAAPMTHVVQVIGSLEADETPKRIYEATSAVFDRIDVLVNNAGAAKKPGGESDGNDVTDFDYLYRVNLRSAAELTQLCMPALEKASGCVVNIGSIASKRTLAGGVAYCVMKAALDRLTETHALLYGEKGVRINSVNPGPTETLIFERNGITGEKRDALDKKVANQTVLGRFGQPSEVSECIKFLASDSASFVTGVCLVADGGALLYTGPKVGVQQMAPTQSDKKSSSNA